MHQDFRLLLDHPQVLKVSLEPGTKKPASCTSSVVYSMKSQKGNIFRVFPGRQMSHNGPASQGEQETAAPRREVLAQAHTAGSGGARALIWVSWLLCISFSEGRENAQGSVQPVMHVRYPDYHTRGSINGCRWALSESQITESTESGGKLALLPNCSRVTCMARPSPIPSPGPPILSVEATGP